VAAPTEARKTVSIVFADVTGSFYEQKGAPLGIERARALLNELGPA
jgi:hypothetical protein